MHQQENWGRAGIIRTTEDEGKGEKGSLSTPRVQNMLITFGHRRWQPSGIGLRGYYNAEIRVNNAP